jgi:hypothetical protein
LNELIRDHGEPVRNALYALLCDQESPLRKIADTSLADNGKSAVGLLVPVLVAQFTLAPAVALLVATLVLKAVMAGGEKAVCEGMILQHRKVARTIRSREHAKATSAAPKKRGSAPMSGMKPKRASTKRRPSAPGEAGEKKDGAKARKPSAAKQRTDNEGKSRTASPSGTRASASGRGAPTSTEPAEKKTRKPATANPAAAVGSQGKKTTSTVPAASTPRRSPVPKSQTED